MSQTFALNMIVRNEMANLERCLTSVVDHISCWIIIDTGSTDGTQDYIKSFFDKHKIPGELHEVPFVNFEQARNAALTRAYASPLAYDYLLLIDADMQLLVDDDFPDLDPAVAAFHITQRDGTLVYQNTRIVKRNPPSRYRGVTHEYLETIGPVQQLDGVSMWDYASGANRVYKCERDIALLEAAIQDEPDNARYWFYLAGAYRDSGQTEKAAAAFAKRAAMGGWVQEVWNAGLNRARCLNQLGDASGFVLQALTAYQQQPNRLETLHDLASYFRKQGMNDVSLLFSEPALYKLTPPRDALFLEDSVYRVGIREEFSIAAFYSSDPVMKARGRVVCDGLAVDRSISAASRDLARQNLRFYIQPMIALFPSATMHHVRFDAPSGYQAGNASIARQDDKLWLVQRCVNYQIIDGRYLIDGGSAIHTRNFLLALDADLNTTEGAEILPPSDLPAPSYTEVLGFEDARAFVRDGELWCSATARELNAQGMCEMVLAKIDRSDDQSCRFTDWRVVGGGSQRHEKNWMPLVTSDLGFIYSCDPTRRIDDHGQTVSESTPTIAAENFRGSSQLIAFHYGWLAIIHEVQANGHLRHYHHRFVWFDQEYTLRKISPQFCFQADGIEYAAGLAWHPNQTDLLISYSINDGQSWIARVVASEVDRALGSKIND